MKSYHDWKYQFLTNILILNTGLDELQARIKIAGRNMNNLRYADTTLMAESEELDKGEGGKCKSWLKTEY